MKSLRIKPLLRIKPFLSESQEDPENYALKTF